MGATSVAGHSRGPNGIWRVVAKMPPTGSVRQSRRWARALMFAATGFGSLVRLNRKALHLNSGNCAEFPVAQQGSLEHDPHHDSRQVREKSARAAQGRDRG